jgi:hypothetical protein
LPLEQKKRRGTARADRTPTDLVAVPPIDAPVVEITVEQAMERTLSAGSAWLAESDSLGLVILRESIEHYADLKADKRSKPKEIQDALKLMMGFAGQCGFTPATRTAMGLAEVKARSKLEEMRDRQAKVGDRRTTG